MQQQTFSTLQAAVAKQFKTMSARRLYALKVDKD